MKICPVVAELFHAERRTDWHKMKLIVTFCNFSTVPNKPTCYSVKWTVLWVNMSENESSVTVFIESFIHWIIKVCWSADTRSKMNRHCLYIFFSLLFCKECDSPCSIPDTGKLSVRLNADMVSSTCTTEWGFPSTILLLEIELLWVTLRLGVFCLWFETSE